MRRAIVLGVGIIGKDKDLQASIKLEKLKDVSLLGA